jgi:hypothetical protein
VQVSVNPPDPLNLRAIPHSSPGGASGKRVSLSQGGFADAICLEELCLENPVEFVGCATKLYDIVC